MVFMVISCITGDFTADKKTDAVDYMLTAGKSILVLTQNSCRFVLQILRFCDFAILRHAVTVVFYDLLIIFSDYGNILVMDNSFSGI